MQIFCQDTNPEGNSDPIHSLHVAAFGSCEWGYLLASYCLSGIKIDGVRRNAQCNTNAINVSRALVGRNSLRGS